MKLFSKIFFLSILLIAWGRIKFPLGENLFFSIGGTPRGVILPLFLLFLYFIWREKDSIKYMLRRNLPLWVFCGFCFLSVSWTSPTDSSYAVEMLLPGILCYIMAGHLLKKQAVTMRQLVLLLSAVPLLVILRGLLFTPEYFLEHGGLDTPFEHYTLIAMMLVFMMPLVLYEIMQPGKKRFLFVAVFALSSIAIIACGSRIGLMSYILVAVLTAIFLSEKKIRISLSLGILLCAAALYFLPVTHQRFDGLKDLGNDPYMITRTRIVDMTAEIIARQPILGTGFSELSYIEKGKELFGEIFFYSHPHNIFLQIPAFLGIAGSCLFLWLAIETGRRILGLAKRTGMLGVTFVISFVGLIFMNMADVFFQSTRMMLLLFIALTVVDSLYFDTEEGQP